MCAAHLMKGNRPSQSYRGQTVKAFVVKKKGAVLTREDIIAHCKKNLAAYKVPRIIEFMDALPKSNVGKILKKELRPQGQDRALAVNSDSCQR